MELNLIWSNKNISLFYKYLDSVIPTQNKISLKINESKLWNLAKNLNDFIKGLIIPQDRFTNIDESIYFFGNLNDLKFSINIRILEEILFPNIFFITENIDPNLISDSKEDIDILLNIIVREISDNLGYQIRYNLEETWERSDFYIYNNEEKILIENFEKTQLGEFLYLLYLRDKFKNNPNVCIIISDLNPLIKKANELEADLNKLNNIEFVNKYPSYADHYLELKFEYQNEKTSIFRLNLLYLILKISSPIITAYQDKFTGEINVNITKTFKALFNRCQRNESRYTVSFVTYSIGNLGHANILIVDRLEQIAERFEPNGAIFYESKEYRMLIDTIDDKLERFFNDNGYTYYRPSQFCPRLGIQLTETFFSKKNGFCVSWSIIYAEERLTSSTSRTYIANNLFNDLIIKYQLIGKTEKETLSNFELWMNDRIYNIFSSMELYYQELSKLLGIKLGYSSGDGGSCLVFTD